MNGLIRRSDPQVLSKESEISGNFSAPDREGLAWVLISQGKNRENQSASRWRLSIKEKRIPAVPMDISTQPKHEDYTVQSYIT